MLCNLHTNIIIWIDKIEGPISGSDQFQALGLPCRSSFSSSLSLYHRKKNVNQSLLLLHTKIWIILSCCAIHSDSNHHNRCSENKVSHLEILIARNVRKRIVCLFSDTLCRLLLSCRYTSDLPCILHAQGEPKSPLRQSFRSIVWMFLIMIVIW